MRRRRSTIRHVLVVDDDETVVGQWKRAISRDRTCSTAMDAATARELADRHGFDLAIIDLRLGTSSGIDLIRQLKRDHPDGTIVLCSGYLSVAAAVSGMQAGADFVIFKPVT